MADRETIVETGRSGSGVGMIAGVLLVVVLFLGLLWIINNNGGSATADVDVPAVNVDVVPDGQ